MDIDSILKGHGVGVGSPIKSLQRGEVVMSAAGVDIPIQAVDLNKAIVLINFSSLTSNGTTNDNMIVFAKLMSETNLRLETVNFNSYRPSTVEYVVIEFNNVKSIQRGDSSWSGSSGTSINVPINTVNLSKSFAIGILKTGDNTSNAIPTLLKTKLVDASTLNFYVNMTTSAVNYVHWQVIEFN